MVTLNKTGSKLSKSNYLFDRQVYFKVISILRLFKYLKEKNRIVWYHAGRLANRTAVS